MAYLCQGTGECWGEIDYLHEPFTECVKLLKYHNKNKQKVTDFITKFQKVFKIYFIAKIHCLTCTSFKQ